LMKFLSKSNVGHNRASEKHPNFRVGVLIIPNL
jgi:hypothetical protein